MLLSPRYVWEARRLKISNLSDDKIQVSLGKFSRP